jgi:uncharacterized protein YpmS
MTFVSKYPFWAYITLIAVPLLVVAIMFFISFVRDRLSKQEEEELEEKKEENTCLSDLSDEDKKKLLEAYLASTAVAEKKGENECAVEADGDGDSSQSSEE